MVSDERPAPKVSVIMSAYNSGAYIRRAIDSILTQIFTDFELVVVDDGSTDNTGAVLDEYAQHDPRVRSFHQANGGPSAAGNRAVAEARGEYLAVLDHDDIAIPDRLGKQVAFLDRNPGIGLVGGAIVAIDHRDRKRPVVYRYPTEPEDVRRALFRGPAINHSSTMMRRELVLRAGCYRVPFDIIPDYDLFLRLSDHTDLATLPDVVVYYRAHHGNVSSRNRAQQQILNQVALELARARLRGAHDEIPPNLVIDEKAISQLALGAHQIERLKGLFASPPSG